MQGSRADELRDVAGHTLKACVLMLLKIDVSWKALRRIFGNRSLQDDVAGRLTGQLEIYRDYLGYNRKVAEIRLEVERISRIVLDFDTLIRDNIGPLQIFVEEVANTDGELSRTLVKSSLLAKISCKAIQPQSG